MRDKKSRAHNLIVKYYFSAFKGNYMKAHKI